MLRHLPRVALPTLIALGACSTAPAPPQFEGITLAAEAPPPRRSGPERPGHLQVLVGSWAFDEKDLFELDEQFSGGLTFSYENPRNPLGFEVGLNRCFDDDGIGSIEITEFFCGVRKTFREDCALQPYVGAGLALDIVDAEVDGLGVRASDDDLSPAAYAHAGVRYRLTDTFGLGLDARIVRGTDVTLFDTGGDVDYEQLGLFFDYRF